MDNQTKLQFNAISFLRFPLIVLVVFIHSYINNPDIPVKYELFSNTQFLICKVIAATAVPLFFFTSGFLFFLNINKWTTDIYIDKLKKRFKSLFIPYVFWISLCILLFFTAQQLPQLSSYFTGDSKLICDYSVIDFLKCYWSTGINGESTPYAYQFWFIRDLMVIVLLSPVVYYFVKYLKIYGVAALFVLWFISAYKVTGLGLVCSFFFTAGAYISINGLNIITVFKKVFNLSMLYPVVIVAIFLTKDQEWNGYLQKAGIALGVVFLFNITSVLLQKNISLPNFLANASFFVFAFHEPFLSLSRKIVTVIIKPASNGAYMLIYFGCATLVIIGCLIVYRILLKLLPGFLSFISGGR